MGWLIFIDILLIIVLALMLSVTVNVHLNDETRIKIRYAGITIFSVSPEDEKHKKQKKSKEKQKKSPDDKSDNISADNEKPVQNTENTADKANGSSDISKESKKTHKVVVAFLIFAHAVNNLENPFRLALGKIRTAGKRQTVIQRIKGKFFDFHFFSSSPSFFGLRKLFSI